MKLSVIGIGAMGRPIAENLIKAGHAVLVYNRTPEPVEALRHLGATVATSIAQACEAEALITMLADDTALEAVVLDSNQFLPSLGQDRVHVSMSTISVAMARRLTEAHRRFGSNFISASVLGRPDAAQEATLSIVAAGPSERISYLSGFFSAIAKNVFVIGDTPFHANIVRVWGNFLLLSAISGLADCSNFARKQDLQVDALLNALTNAILTVPFYRSYGSLMIEEKFMPAGFKLKLGLKDIDLLLQAAHEVRFSMPAAALVAEQLRRAANQGLAEYDVAALACLECRDACH